MHAHPKECMMRRILAAAILRRIVQDASM